MFIYPQHTPYPKRILRNTDHIYFSMLDLRKFDWLRTAAQDIITVVYFDDSAYVEGTPLFQDTPF